MLGRESCSGTCPGVPGLGYATGGRRVNKTQLFMSSFSGVFSNVSAEAVCIVFSEVELPGSLSGGGRCETGCFPAVALHHTNCIRRLHMCIVHCGMWLL